MSSTTTTDLTTVHWAADGADDFFGAPFVDVDETRTSPIAYRYVHGGFSGTDTRFSFYFPAADVYEGRFYEHVTPVPQHEHLATENEGEGLVFYLESGGYFVETNGGGPGAADPFSGLDPLIGAYRANAASARFSREVARAIYGDHRPFGYLFGGSGGAYRTLGASENTEGVWDGFVPFVPGSPVSIPNVFSVRMHAYRILKDVLPAIVDAYDVGGDPSTLTLTTEQAAALEEVTRMGFPPRSWFGWKTMGMHGFSALYPGVMAMDPTFASDFWSVEGYLGADPTSSVHRDRVTLTTTIAELLVRDPEAVSTADVGGVDEAFKEAGNVGEVVAVRLADAVAGGFLGAQLTIADGPAAGTTLRLSAVENDIAALEGYQAELIALLEVGTEVVVDNSNFLAAQTYHRHQVPGPEYAVWDQFRDENGAPIYPQRPMLIGPLFARGAAGTVTTGKVSGKVITISALLDREAFPWQADWLRQRVEEHLGAEADDRFRIWYVDNALHGDGGEQEFADRSVSYIGILETALRQLAAWVERGIEPAPNSSYAVVDGQLVIPAEVSQRGGVQPTVSVLANGEPSTTVRVGEPVTVRVSAEAPAPGKIVEIVPVDNGELQPPLPVTPERAVSAEYVRTFATPGTYFVATRISSQVDGDATSPHTRAQNIARARVVVVD